VSVRRHLGDECGQILPLLAAGLAVVLLGMTAFTVDVGRLLLVQRHMQAGADAAALAGANKLPDAAAATSAARAYAADPVNGPGDASGLTSTVTTRCLKSTPSCTASSPNVVAVTEHAKVGMAFASLLGIDPITVNVTSTASQAVSTKPLDIALVLDRTGSMSGQIDNLIAGAKSFLDTLDPAFDRVALVVLPPAQSCDRYGHCDYYPLGNGGYLIEPLTSDFSQLKSDVQSLTAEGSTSYKQALAAAYAELQAHGRSDADKAIVFETDGAANAVPDDAYQQPMSWLGGFGGGMSIPYGWPASGRSDDIDRPCGSAVDYAASLGVPVYTLGFNLSRDQTCYEAPHKVSYSSVGYRSVRESGTDASTALAQMAERSGGKAFLQEDGRKLAQTFAQVASELQPARLVPDNS